MATGQIQPRNPTVQLVVVVMDCPLNCASSPAKAKGVIKLKKKAKASSPKPVYTRPKEEFKMVCASYCEHSGFP